MRRRLGPILAATLLAGLIAVTAWRLFRPAHSPPRETAKKGMLDLKTIDVRLLADVVGFRPGAEGNAGDDYATAADLAEKGKAAIDRAASAVDSAGDGPAEIGRADRAVLEEIAAHVAAGARKKELRYVFVHTPRTLEVAVRLAGLDRLMTAADAMRVLAKYHLSLGEVDRAEGVFRDLLVFGWHMQTERKHVHAVTTGLEIQRLAWFGLRGIHARPGAQDDQRLDALRAYETAAVELSSLYRDKRQIVWSADVRAGDLFHIIEHDQDPAWRVQAILALGRARSMLNDVDAKHAEKLLGTLARCADPVLAAAARAAKDHAHH